MKTHVTRQLILYRDGHRDIVEALGPWKIFYHDAGDSSFLYLLVKSERRTTWAHEAELAITVEYVNEPS